MKVLNKLTKNGNSTQVTIPARLLEFLRWRCGDRIVVELTDRGTVEIRQPTGADIRNSGIPLVLDNTLPEVKA